MTIDNFDPCKLYDVKGNETFNFKCKKCEAIFSIRATKLKSMLKGTSDKQFCCSRKCASLLRSKSQNIKCTECNSLFNTKYIDQKFCSQSCSARFNNQNKKHGNRRSKLEIWIESRLGVLFPNIEMHFNRKDTINAELDIFIPSLKLAFELNGIFHYEPIFSKEKLLSSQTNDKRKMQACFERNIELCVIDTSAQKYFKPETSEKYLKIITDLINVKTLPD